MLERFNREWIGPSDRALSASYEILTHEGLFCFTGENSYIRTFEAGDQAYDQIVLETEPGKFKAFPLHHPAWANLKRTMEEYGYPHYHLPEPDEATLVWHERLSQEGRSSRES